jgi:hypothetical protein
MSAQPAQKQKRSNEGNRKTEFYEFGAKVLA